MKKIRITITLVFALIAGVFSSASAQTIVLEDCLISGYQIKEGSNSVPIPKGHGTLRFQWRGGNIMNVMVQDAAGTIIRVGEDNDPSANNPNPVPTCKGEMHCSENKKYNTVVCFCVPDLPLTAGTPPAVLIGLLLPAVQKVR